MQKIAFLDIDDGLAQIEIKEAPLSTITIEIFKNNLTKEARGFSNGNHKT